MLMFIICYFNGCYCCSCFNGVFVTMCVVFDDDNDGDDCNVVLTLWCCCMLALFIIAVVHVTVVE